MPETSNFNQIIQQWLTFVKQGNTAGLAGLYTSDAVGVFGEGIFDGVTAIINNLVGQFGKGWAITTLTDKEDHQPTPTSTWGWSVGDWSGTFKGPVSGHWSVLWVQQSGAWKIQEQTVVQTVQQS